MLYPSLASVYWLPSAQKKHENAFLSLSTVINHKHANHRALIASCSPGRILVESDYNDVNMCTTQTWQMINIVANVRGWVVETDDTWVDEPHPSQPEGEWGVIRRLQKNWMRFKDGHHPVRQTRKQKKRPEYYYSEDSDSENLDR